jgi:cytosine/adenosine deaminase-related metal-dependent hydrolase
MHTHLEESILRGIEKNDTETFNSWMMRRRRQMAGLTPDAVISSVRLAIRESLANGITTIADTTHTDIPTLVLKDEPIRSWVFHELSPENNSEQENCIASVIKRIERCRRDGNTGIAPHAVYSLSPAHHKAVADKCRTSGYAWSSHIAESAEELQAFSAKSGEIFDYVCGMQEWPYGESDRGSMYYALTNSLIPRHGICIHCNYMSLQELSLMAALDATIVFCPQYNSHAGHKPFPIDVALNHGCNVCLGTESPSISRPMNLFDDLFNLKMTYPHLTPVELIKTVTENPAHALRNHSIGKLEAGRKADIIGLRFPHDPKGDILEDMIMSDANVTLVIVNGEEVIAEK